MRDGSRTGEHDAKGLGAAFPRSVAEWLLMVGTNSGGPMVARVVGAVRASQAVSVIAVMGHECERVDVPTVRNPDYAAGAFRPR